MILLVLRHGIAEGLGPDGSDYTRRLTEEGIDKTRRVAEALTGFAPTPDVILHSPLTRATQTAAIVGEAFEREPIEAEPLAYGPAGAVVEMLAGRSEEVVMVVGHEPTLSELVAQLCTGEVAHGFVQMKKAGCACVDLGAGRPGRTLGYGVLRWLVTPKALLGE